jgi:hypothetical protein
LIQVFGFVKDPQKKGDCFLSNISLSLYDDASFDFQAIFSSDNEGDVWIIKFITFYGANGGQIGDPVPKHDSQPSLPAEAGRLFFFSDSIPGVTPDLAQRITGCYYESSC